MPWADPPPAPPRPPSLDERVARLESLLDQLAGLPIIFGHILSRSTVERLDDGRLAFTYRIEFPDPSPEP